MKKLCFLIVAVCGMLICGINDAYAQRATTGTINGHEYVDLGLSVKWATCNVGANSPEGYGNYYEWEDAVSVAKSWGGSWRLPTEEEFHELIDNCDWEWTTYDGENGYVVTSKKNGNSIFLPAAGWRDGDDEYGQGSNCLYWSSTPYGTDRAYFLYFYSGYHYTGWGYRDGGHSVRPVAE